MPPLATTAARLQPSADDAIEVQAEVNALVVVHDEAPTALV